MPPRPSRNIDQLLLQAGQELLPHAGARDLSIRKITERAGVNLGMFHYHFKTKDAFVRTVLQDKYNSMFAALTSQTSPAATSLENLRCAVSLVARWGRDNRHLLVRLLGDAFAGEKVVQEFMQANMPRHVMVIMAHLQAAQKDKFLRKLPPAQAMSFLIGSVAAPILLITAAGNGTLLQASMVDHLSEAVLTDAAIEERIDMALKGLSANTKQGAKK